jgi:hypothetical protein
MVSSADLESAAKASDQEGSFSSIANKPQTFFLDRMLKIPDPIFQVARMDRRDDTHLAHTSTYSAACRRKSTWRSVLPFGALLSDVLGRH